MFSAFSHVSIVVPDIEVAAQVLFERYGLAIGQRLVNERQGVRLAYAEVAGGRIELMEPSRPDSSVARFLERNPKGGIHHFSLRVDDIEQTMDKLGERGVRVLGDGKPQYNISGERIAFIHPADFLGALVELEETHPKKQGERP